MRGCTPRRAATRRWPTSFSRCSRTARAVPKPCRRPAAGTYGMRTAAARAWVRMRSIGCWVPAAWALVRGEHAAVRRRVQDALLSSARADGTGSTDAVRVLTEAAFFECELGRLAACAALLRRADTALAAAPGLRAGAVLVRAELDVRESRPAAAIARLQPLGGPPRRARRNAQAGNSSFTSADRSARACASPSTLMVCMPIAAAGFRFTPRSSRKTTSSGVTPTRSQARW